MTKPHTQLTDLPSMRKLVTTTGVAIGIAALLLVAFVMPAEYGIDPLHTGAVLGLKALSAPPPRAEAPPAGATMYKPVVDGPTALYAAPYKADTAEFRLGAYEYLEYKYRLEKDASMVFTWTSSADVNHDFHGEPDDKELKEQSFDKKPRREGSGAFEAPFTGIHGWFWENPGSEAITIRLHTAGFYASAVEIRSDRTRRAHELTTLQSSTTNSKTD